ncbi:MAG: hypothetical protein U0835_18475 [Isosphaeraceae bacterium]
MEPTQELVDALYRGKVLQARRMRPEQKLLAGPELFELACELTRAGIRSQNPGADDAQVEAILTRRLAIGKRLEGAR